MDSSPYMAHLRRELAAFDACLSGDLSAPIEHCDDWTLYDLADHMCRGNLWAAVAITESRGDYRGACSARWPGRSAELVPGLVRGPARRPRHGPRDAPRHGPRGALDTDPATPLDTDPATPLDTDPATPS
ncbi:MAG: maleylpyruvate isomerase N-terminal domain-containing protein [Dermatophilaceae bacterium]